MAWKVLSYKLTSACQMLVHNGQTADPLNKWAKAMKAITGKRNKTDADHEELSRLEFLAGLYIGQDGPIIPAVNIDAMLINAAKKLKEGNSAKVGIFCAEHARMDYDGPRTAEELFSDDRFRHVAIVRVNAGRVARTRPIFHEWSAVVKMNLEDSVLNASQLDRWFAIAGTQVGLGDWRPQNGRFQAVRL
jgi:hypothetical protein